MNIAFLDAATLGDSDTSAIAQLGNLTNYETTAPSETLERVKGADIVITNKVVIDRDVIESASNLKLICVAATGTNCVDIEAATELGIPVKNVAGYSTPHVTQQAIGMMINLASSIHHYAAESKQWSESPIFTRLDHSISDLAGKTLGIIGLGAIGESVAQVAEVLGMNVIALDRKGDSNDLMRKPKEEFFREADFVSLHCPLSDETVEIINEETLSLMKPTAYLVNTGRGQLINEQDLLSALIDKKIAGAALDVLCQEPPCKNNPLINADLPNLLITPHTAWASSESRDKLVQGVAENIRQFLFENK